MKHIKNFLDSFLHATSLSRKDLSSMDLKDLQGLLRRSQIKTVVGGILSTVVATTTLSYIVPVYREYPLYSALFLLSVWLPLITTSAAVFLFSPISIFASERFIIRKIFFAFMLIIAMTPVLSIYIAVGERITDISSPHNDKIVSDALRQSGYIQYLPSERMIPLSEDDQPNESSSEPSSGTKGSFDRKYIVALNSNALSAIVFLTSSSRSWGITAIILVMLATWLDTMLAAWRIKRRVYGSNSLEAEELSQFMWKFENHDGGGDHWIRSPAWVRGYNKPLFGISEPEARNG